MAAETHTIDGIEIRPGRRLSAELIDIRQATGAGFETEPAEELALSLAGIVGDNHAGFTRKSGGREPWYPRGTEIRSGRQITIVSEEELSAVAQSLQLPTVDAGAIGANLVLRGVPRLSLLPAGTRLVLPSGAALVVEATNAPCKIAGRSLMRLHPDRADLELGFVTAARYRRGLVASAERAGAILRGPVEVRIPAQWLYA